MGLRAPAAGPLAALGLPLVATSANEPGGPDPARLDDVPDGLRRGAAAAVNAGALPGTASAVVNLRALAGGGPAILVRPGPDPGAVAGALRGAGAPVETSSPGCTLEPSQPPEPGSGA